MVLDENDMDFSRQAKYMGKYAAEKLETTIFETHLKSDMTVVDLGANLGFYSLLVASIVGPKGKVFAFDPSPTNIELIKLSVKENNFSNVVVVEAAVSDHVGKSELCLSPFYNSEHSLFGYHYSSGPCKNNKEITVDVITLDHYLKNIIKNNHVDLIKMDIEGSESQALKGMKKTIDENENLILMTEFWPNGFKNAGSNPREFLEELERLGFRIYHIDEFEQEVYPVLVDEMMKITNQRVKNHVEKSKEVQCGGWYSNLLCIK